MEQLSKNVSDFINRNSSIIDADNWDAVFASAYVALSNEEAAELYQALTTTLTVDLEADREAALVTFVVGILHRRRGHAEALDVQDNMKNYLGMEYDDFLDFIRNYDDEWYCEFDDNGYMLILR